MKRFRAIFVIFCVIFLAALSSLPHARADTLRSRLNAPERVQAVFTSNTGKTVITLDAIVTVPEAAQMHLIPVTGRFPDTEELKRYARLFWPGIPEKVNVSDGKGSVYSGHSEHILMVDKAKDIRVEVSTGWKRYPGLEGQSGGSLWATVRYDNEHRRKGTINYNAAYMNREIDWDIEGHPLTLAQAAAIADARVKEITDEPFALFMAGESPGIIYDDQLMLAGKEREGTGTSYNFVYTRVAEGAPLLPCLHELQITYERPTAAAPPMGYEQILIAVNKAGEITNCDWHNPCVVGEAGEACALLPKDDILSIAETIFPLKQQYYEQTLGGARTAVTRVSLGYMAVLQRYQAETYALTPVWNFYGRVTLTRDGETFSELPLLTLNAIDGTVIDRKYGY